MLDSLLRDLRFAWRSLRRRPLFLVIPVLSLMIGIAAMVAFNLADTFFVSRLGTDELAAMSFTFPVVLIINSIALGLGIGGSAVISRAIGEGDHHRVQRLTTHGLALALLIVAFFVAVGLLTIDPVFRLLGAEPRLMPLIRQYIIIWYLGMLIVGGMGSTMGAIFGTVFLKILSELIVVYSPAIADFFPAVESGVFASLGHLVFALVLLLFLIFEPRGLNHRWEIIKASYRLHSYAY